MLARLRDTNLNCSILLQPMEVDFAELNDSFLSSPDDFLVRNVAWIEDVEAMTCSFATPQNLIQCMSQFSGLHVLRLG